MWLKHFSEENILLNQIFESNFLKNEFFISQTPWEEVRNEMVNEKGLDKECADMIGGEYVKNHGWFQVIHSSYPIHWNMMGIIPFKGLICLIQS